MVIVSFFVTSFTRSLYRCFTADLVKLIFFYAACSRCLFKISVVLKSPFSTVCSVQLVSLVRNSGRHTATRLCAPVTQKLCCVIISSVYEQAGLLMTVHVRWWRWSLMISSQALMQFMKLVVLSSRAKAVLKQRRRATNLMFCIISWNLFVPRYVTDNCCSMSHSKMYVASPVCVVKVAYTFADVHEHFGSILHKYLSLLDPEGSWVRGQGVTEIVNCRPPSWLLQWLTVGKLWSLECIVIRALAVQLASGTRRQSSARLWWGRQFDWLQS